MPLRLPEERKWEWSSSAGAGVLGFCHFAAAVIFFHTGSVWSGWSDAAAAGIWFKNTAFEKMKSSDCQSYGLNAHLITCHDEALGTETGHGWRSWASVGYTAGVQFPQRPLLLILVWLKVLWIAYVYIKLGTNIINGNIVTMRHLLPYHSARRSKVHTFISFEMQPFRWDDTSIGKISPSCTFFLIFSVWVTQILYVRFTCWLFAILIVDILQEMKEKYIFSLILRLVVLFKDALCNFF